MCELFDGQVVGLVVGQSLVQLLFKSAIALLLEDVGIARFLLVGLPGRKQSSQRLLR